MPDRSADVNAGPSALLKAGGSTSWRSLPLLRLSVVLRHQQRCQRVRARVSVLAQVRQVERCLDGLEQRIVVVEMAIDAPPYAIVRDDDHHDFVVEAARLVTVRTREQGARIYVRAVI